MFGCFAYMYVNCMYAWFPQMSEEDIGSGIGVTDDTDHHVGARN